MRIIFRVASLWTLFESVYSGYMLSGSKKRVQLLKALPVFKILGNHTSAMLTALSNILKCNFSIKSALSQGVQQLLNLIGTFPGEVRIITAKMPIITGLSVNRTPKIQLFNNSNGT